MTQRVPALLSALLILAATPAASQPASSFGFSNRRYTDSTNMVTASQLLGAPTPLLKGKDGDWRLSAAPAWVGVEADPMSFEGTSLNLSFNRLISGDWGLYAAVFWNQVTSLSTRYGGEPHPLLIRMSFSGLDADPAFLGRHPAGATLSTLSFGAVATRRVERESAPPVTFYGGPLLTRLHGEHLDYDYEFTGTYGGGTSYRMDFSERGDFNVWYYGTAVGAATEYRFGKVTLVPHVVAFLMVRGPQTGTMTFSTTETCGGSPCGQAVDAYDTPPFYKFVRFAVPGLDLVYGDWGLSMNLLEPVAGPVMHAFDKSAAWPFSLRLTKHFGRYER